MAKRDIYQEVTNIIIESLESGVVPWRKPWVGGEPYNLATGKKYRGINTMLLGLKPYKSPCWLTFKQVREMGGNVIKGQKSTMIVFWKISKYEDKEGDEQTSAFVKHYNVFNIEQCEGIESPEIEPLEDNFNPIDEAELVISNWTDRPTINHEGINAFYSPSNDSVTMPDQSLFNCSEEYYSTLFHELGHSTGHSKRLDRGLDTKIAAFGSADYSKEELVAEFSSQFLCSSCGIVNTIDNSAAYIKGWLSKLKGNKELAIKAAGKAQKASDMILGVEL